MTDTESSDTPSKPTESPQSPDNSSPGTDTPQASTESPQAHQEAVQQAHADADIERRLSSLGESVANLTKLLTTFMHQSTPPRPAGSPDASGSENLTSAGKPAKTSFYDLDL